MNKELERFFEYAALHGVSFVHYKDLNYVRYCEQMYCEDCEFNSSCFNDGCLELQNFQYIKEHHPEYLI